MKKIGLFFAVVLLTNLSYADEWNGNLNFVLGSRSLDSKYWAPVETQPALDIKVDFGEESWPLNLLIGISGSSKTTDCSSGIYSISCKGSISEFYIGGIRYFKVTSSFSPYLALGASSVRAEATVAFGALSITGSDNTTGYFINGGAMWKLGAFNIGLDARVLSGANIKLSSTGTSGKADYGQFGLLIGYNW